MAYRKLDKEEKKKKDSQRSATKSQSPLALMSSAGTSSGSVDLPFFKLSSFFLQVFKFLGAHRVSSMVMRGTFSSPAQPEVVILTGV